MMAVNSSMPKLPRLEIVKVAPVYSSGDRALVRARSMRVLELVVDLNDSLGSAVLHDGGDQTVRLSHSQTNVDAGVILDEIPFPAGVDLLVPLDGLGHKLDHKSVETHLVGQLFIEFGPGIQDVIHADAEFEVKVGAWNFDSPKRLAITWRLRLTAIRSSLRALPPKTLGAKLVPAAAEGVKAFHVGFDHSASRTRAGDLSNVVALLLGEFFGQGAGFDFAASSSLGRRSGAMVK
jgi:hypothetical protein